MSETTTALAMVPERKRKRKDPGSPLGTCRVCGQTTYCAEGRIIVDGPTIVVYHNGACEARFRQAWAEMLGRLGWAGTMG